MKFGVVVLSLFSIAAGTADRGVSSPTIPQEQTAADTANRTALEKLQGDWRITWFNDQQLPADAEAYLVVRGDKYEQWTGNQMDERGTIKVDASATLMKVDLVIAEGSDAGQTQLGVYELAEDTLTLALGTPGGKTRPLSLSQGEIYVVLKKAK